MSTNNESIAEIRSTDYEYYSKLVTKFDVILTVHRR